MAPSFTRKGMSQPWFSTYTRKSAVGPEQTDIYLKEPEPCPISHSHLNALCNLKMTLTTQEESHMTPADPRDSASQTGSILVCRKSFGLAPPMRPAPKPKKLSWSNTGNRSTWMALTIKPLHRRSSI